MINTEPQRCPSCDIPLRVGIQFSKGHYRARWIVWCGYGPCKCIVANDGGEGDSITSALADFDKKVEAALDQMNDIPCDL